MKITKTREDFFVLYSKLGLLSNLSGAKFAYAIMRIRQTIKQEIDRITGLGKMSEAWTAYDKERLVLLEQYADKDERGKYKIVNGNYQVSDENLPIYEQELEKLKLEHPGAIDEFDKKNADIAELMKEDIELELYEVKESQIPESITVEQLEVIADLIIEK